MKRFDLPLISDVLFYGVCAFFLSLGVLRFYRVPLSLSAVAALLIALSVAGIIFLLLNIFHRRKFLNKKEREERDKLLMHLALEREERVRADLLTALTADGISAHCASDFLSDGTTAYLAEFTMQPLSADRIAEIIRKFGRENYVVLCNALSPEAERLAASFGVRLMRGNEVYDLFHRNDCMPNPMLCAELEKRNIKRTVRRVFSKRSAHPFLVSGIFLLVMSLFTFFPVYYLISGSAMLFLAVCVRLFGFVPQT